MKTLETIKQERKEELKHKMGEDKKVLLKNAEDVIKELGISEPYTVSWREGDDVVWPIITFPNHRPLIIGYDYDNTLFVEVEGDMLTYDNLADALIAAEKPKYQNKTTLAIAVGIVIVFIAILKFYQNNR